MGTFRHGSPFRRILCALMTLIGVAGPVNIACAAGSRGALTADYQILVFSKTEGFRHTLQIAAGIQMFETLGTANGFTVDATEDATAFTEENLADYEAVVFLNTTGNVLDPAQEAAFEQYIQSGGGFIGIHSATDTEYGWEFYGSLVGAYFGGHPPVQEATLYTVDPTHPSTMHLDPFFAHNDEWYNFRTNPADDPSIGVLVTIDETTYSGGDMGDPHPISWRRQFSGGRSWYTAMGHTVSTYSEEFFRLHVLGGLEWVVFEDDATCPADLDGDGQVGAEDLAAALGSWGPGEAPSDFDEDGAVDGYDLAALLGSWGPCD